MSQNRSQAAESEARVETFTKLKKTPGSGCGILFKGDNGNEYWHYEDKSTRRRTVKFDRNWIEKVKKQAKDTRKPFWALGLSTFNCRVVIVPNYLARELFVENNKALTVQYQTKFFSRQQLLDATKNSQKYTNIWLKLPDVDSFETAYSLISELQFVELVKKLRPITPEIPEIRIES